ncbi:hypothetical protein MKW94_012847 [Papaver nudicaule]|uniref:Uncharacterized protein n=1 Tax=Papaver nudicaule TaxID=74823 RepID=A0AA41RQ73_PAPNU|nr:hypothetical protein [Papaver nudicaule]
MKMFFSQLFRLLCLILLLSRVAGRTVLIRRLGKFADKPRSQPGLVRGSASGRP